MPCDPSLLIGRTTRTTRPIISERAHTPITTATASCGTRPIPFTRRWRRGSCCSRISRCSVATTPRREVKHEWSPAREYSLLIAAQVIRVAVRARIRGMSSILGIGLLLLCGRLTFTPRIGSPQPAVAAEGVLTVGKLATRDSPRSRLGLPARWWSCAGGWPENGVFMYCFHISFSSPFLPFAGGASHGLARG